MSSRWTGTGFSDPSLPQVRQDLGSETRREVGLRHDLPGLVIPTVIGQGQRPGSLDGILSALR